MTTPKNEPALINVSAAMRRYAAEIYRLQQDYPQVSVSLLTGQIDASAQAAAQMIRRLSEGGFLVHQPYRGVRLTESGEQIAMPALRRHRLTEVFLVRIMGYDWASAHELTDTFELGINDALEDRMDELTGHPTRCPHGEPIPSKAGIMPLVEDRPLIEIAPGSACILSRVRTHDMDKLRYIATLDLIPGVTFQLVSSAPFNGPLRLRLKSHDHVIGYELAGSLWVEVSGRGEG